MNLKFLSIVSVVFLSTQLFAAEARYGVRCSVQDVPFQDDLVEAQLQGELVVSKKTYTFESLSVLFSQYSTDYAKQAAESARPTAAARSASVFGYYTADSISNNPDYATRKYPNHVQFKLKMASLPAWDIQSTELLFPKSFEGNALEQKDNQPVLLVHLDQGWSIARLTKCSVNKYEE